MAMHEPRFNRRHLSQIQRSQNAGIDLHVEKRYGRSPHHVVEAVFKGVARALRAAVEIDPREQGLPTVKGAL